MSSKLTTEILVHISAPSRAADDSDYRLLAAAYLSFEPAARTRVGPFNYNATNDPSTVSLPGSQQPPVSSLEPGVFQSAEVSFASVAHNLLSPELRRSRALGVGDASQPDPFSQSSWQAPPSVVADSNPENNISIARYCSPTRILEHYLQGFDSSQSNSSEPVPSVTGPTSSQLRTADGEAILGFQEATAPGTGPHTCHTSPQIPVIPLSPCLPSRKRTRDATPTPKTSDDVVFSSIPSQSSRPPNSSAPYAPKEPLASSSNASEPNPPSSLSLAEGDTISRADSEPPEFQKRPKRSDPGINSYALVRSSSDVGPRQELAKRQQLDRRQRAHQTPDGLEIHSQEPAVSCEDLDVSDVVTESLEKLAKDVDINKRFLLPKKQTRELRPFERGYWLVDCSAWPEQVRQQAWGFLTNYVGNGIAGWGVWCRRDQDFNWIRLYCWGSIAGHMHLVLWLASHRQLNYTRSTWIGGDGEVVITMEAKYA